MAVTEQANIGMRVELDVIEAELKKLWAEGEGAMTRASLVNLAVYSEEPDSLSRNAELISRVMENHACRAIVIEANRAAREDRAEAWINAHCHVHGGAKQICSEQISFRLEGTKLLTSVLFSHLDSDLPLYLWWQAELRAPVDPQLWPWVDRLIYDSRDWRDFGAQMQLARAAQGEAAQRQMVLCDLNWTRLLHFRFAFAQFFDDPGSHRCFSEIDELTLSFGNGYRSTALLFIGWIAAQLGWNLGETSTELELQNADGAPVAVELREEGDAALEVFCARAGKLELAIQRAECGDLLEVSRGQTRATTSHQLLPAGDNDLASLVSEELMRGGDRRVYLRAVEKVRRFL